MGWGPPGDPELRSLPQNEGPYWLENNLSCVYNVYVLLQSTLTLLICLSFQVPLYWHLRHQLTLLPEPELDNANTTTVTVSPNRKNIRLGVVSVSHETLDCVDWVVREVKENGISMGHILIYCRTIKAIGRVFNYIMGELDEFAWVGNVD